MYTALSLTCIVTEGFSTLEMHLLLFQLAEVVFFEPVMFAAVEFLFIATIMNVTCWVPSTGALTVPVNRKSVVCAHDSHTGWCRHPFTCHGMMPCDLFPWQMFWWCTGRRPCGRHVYLSFVCLSGVFSDVGILLMVTVTCDFCPWQVFGWSVDSHSYLWFVPMTGVLAGLGILAVIIFEIYILYKLLGTHMGQKWRTMWLGQLLLFGIFLCYLTLFAYLPVSASLTCLLGFRWDSYSQLATISLTIGGCYDCMISSLTTTTKIFFFFYSICVELTIREK